MLTSLFPTYLQPGLCCICGRPGRHKTVDRDLSGLVCGDCLAPLMMVDLALQQRALHLLPPHRDGGRAWTCPPRG